MLDFQFNHNQCFASTVEHAESRLLRRLFQIKDVIAHHEDIEPPAAAGTGVAAAAASGEEKAKGAAAPARQPGAEQKQPPQRQPPQRKSRYRHTKYSKVLTKVTIYTSLESCAQCSGIMALARLRDVFFLQSDHSMYCVGNIMHNASPPHMKAPRPHSIAELGLGDLISEMDEAFLKFEKVMQEGDANEDEAAVPPFVRRGRDRRPKWSASVTTFLCSEWAKQVFEKHKIALGSLALEEPDFRPPNIPSALTNAECLLEAQDFFDYVTNEGHRGTHNVC